MSPKQLAKCCLYYKEEVLDVIVVINWSGLWGRSWLCWGLTRCRRWRLTSPSLWRRHLRGERAKRSQRWAENNSLTHLTQGLHSLSWDKAQPPPPLHSHLSNSIFHFISIPAPVVLRLLSQFYYFTRCLLIIIWFFFHNCTIFQLFLVPPILEEPCTCSVTSGLEPNGSWHVTGPLPSPVLLIKFLCMVYTATLGRVLLSPRVFLHGCDFNAIFLHCRGSWFNAAYKPGHY